MTHDTRIQSAERVSVIIPAYNTADYLPAAISSVLGQTFPAMEVIVVDDGSTDHSADVAEQFGGRVLCHRRPHAGIAASRNFGASVAGGVWLAFLDSDDLWVPSRLEWQLALVHSNPSLELVFGGVEQFIGPELNAEQRARLATPPPPGAAPHVGSMLVRKEAFFRTGLFDESLKMGEFIDWYARACELKLSMATLPQTVLRRRWHLANTTLQQKDSLTDLATVMKRMLDRRRRTPPTA